MEKQNRSRQTTYLGYEKTHESVVRSTSNTKSLNNFYMTSDEEYKVIIACYLVISH